MWLQLNPDVNGQHWPQALGLRQCSAVQFHVCFLHHLNKLVDAKTSKLSVSVGYGGMGRDLELNGEEMRDEKEGVGLTPPCVFMLSVHSGIPSCNYDEVENDGKKRMRGCWRL